jgi:flavorubredoxin
MPAVEVKPDIYWIGVNDRTTDLFEGLWPITSEGVSYNAYLIDDKKKVLIDLAKGIKTDEFFEQIAEIVALTDIDYVVINHMEPDHTGIVRTLKRLSPKVTFICSEKAEKMLKDYYDIAENVRTVTDGETLELGTRKLTFYATPFVHWPETMMTYENTEKILFSCDGFGGYGALRGAIFDDQCTDQMFYEREALRYFVNIVAKFSRPVLKAIDKLASVPVSIIAPSHGLIWRARPAHIVSLYRKWSEYATGKGETGITIVYGSMYGNTETVMNAIGQGISSAGVALDIFDTNRTHVSYILPSLWINNAVMIGAPTYEGGLFPPVANVVQMAVRKGIKRKKTAMFGSYGWSGGALKDLVKIVEPAQWEMVDTLEFAGGPTKDLLEKAERFGAVFAENISSKADNQA